MKTLIHGAVGPYRAAAGVETPVRLGSDSEAVVTELHGKYYEQSFRSGIFRAFQAVGGVALTNVGTTAGFALANPANSGVNVSILKIIGAIKVLPATPIIGYVGIYVSTNPVGAAVTGTALTVIGSPLGVAKTGQGKPFTTATLPASPALFDIFWQKTATAEAPVSPPQTFERIYDGDFLLGPGSTLSVMQDAGDATNATVICGVVWEEVAI